MRTALTIAGSDSSGGAGVQADLKTFAAFGVYGVSAVTAVTAQSTSGITASMALPADVVAAQIEAVAGDVTVSATKIGMLATAAIVEAVVAAIEGLELPLVVTDPVELLKKVARSLKPQGRVGMVDFTPGAGGPGPAPEERVAPETEIRTAEAAGLQLIKREDVPPFMFLLVFGRK